MLLDLQRSSQGIKARQTQVQTLQTNKYKADLAEPALGGKICYLLVAKTKVEEESLRATLRESSGLAFLPPPPRELDSANYANTVGVTTGYYLPFRHMVQP